MNRQLLIFMIFFLAKTGKSQNLVPNPSFEDLTKCPSTYLLSKELHEYCPPWLSPTDGSPDILSTCITNPHFSVPYCHMNLDMFDTSKKCYSYQNPRTGNNFASYFIANYIYQAREYPQVSFSMPLVQNMVYYVRYYINMHDCSGMFTSDFGAYISKEPPRRYDPDPTLDPCQNLFCPELQPQITNKKGIIRDTADWVEIGGYYKAEGGEAWLTIGSFQNRLLEYDSINELPAIIFVDDVSVEPAGSVNAVTTAVCKGDTAHLVVDFNTSFYWSSRSEGSDTFSLQSELKFIPDSSFHLYLFTPKGIADKIEIKVKEKVPDLGIKTEYIKCQDSIISFHLPESPGLQYLLNDKTVQVTFSIQNEGTYRLQAGGEEYCEISRDFTVRDSKIDESSADTNFCFENNAFFTLYAGENYSEYWWEPLGSTLPYADIMAGGHYSLEITDSNGCFYRLNYNVTDWCDVILHVPNAFSPGRDDELNAVFKPMAKYVDEYHLVIYNRWGQKIFETEDPIEGWDGSYENMPCSTGVYFYILTFSGQQNGKFVRDRLNGNIHLLR